MAMNISGPTFVIDSPLVLPEDEVQIWRVDLESMRAEEARWLEILSPDEAKRADRFHFPADRQRFTAARAWLRKILGAYLDAPPKEISFSYSEKEKPALTPPFSDSAITFNLSHSGEVALYAFTRARNIGVDVEIIRRDFDVEAIARRFFSQHEQSELAAFPPAERIDAFYRCWTRKEAYIKATGDGLSLPLDQFDVSLISGSSSALLSTRPDSAEAARWRLSEVPVGEGYAAAVCVRGIDWKLRP